MPQFQNVASERDAGLTTRIDFLAGSPPLWYNVPKAILDAGYRVGIPNLNPMLDNVAVFKRQGDLYVMEQVINL